MRISVIIPTCDRLAMLALCLERIGPGRQTGLQLEPTNGATTRPGDWNSVTADYYEVIVTDDGRRSSAEALVQARFPWVKWIPGPNRGPAANRNNGARVARGEWLVFTDDDCLPEPGWLQAFAAAIREFPNAIALEGSIHPLGNFADDMVDCPVNLDGGHFWSANIAVQKEAYYARRGFDENFPSAAHEDQDLFHRLGGKAAVPFILEAAIFHPVRRFTIGQKLKTIPVAFESWVYYLLKNRRPRVTMLGVILAAARNHVPPGFRHVCRLRLGRAVIHGGNFVIALLHARKAVRRARTRLQSSERARLISENP